MPKASIFTLGCRVNQYESDAIEEQLLKRNFDIVPFGEKCDIVIINTCTVTAESDRKSRQHIRRAKKTSPDASVIVTGCFAHVSPDEAKAIEGVTAVIGNKDKNAIAELAVALVNDCTYTVPENSDRGGELTISKAKRARCHIKIEDGCPKKCAYCIIPAARGQVVSKSPEIVLHEAAEIASNGCQEIILTGIETASYGADLEGWDLSKILYQLDNIEGIKRIGVSSLDPSVMKEEFVRRLSETKHLLPHFHLSVQSGTTATLNRMRRRYTAERVAENMELVRKYIPEATFSADVIVGFPGETDEDFETTVDFFKKTRFMHLHIFPYSIRQGTEAAKMPDQVPENVKKKEQHD
ncbi:MAG: tRNA (N(6)-L-threonylcarbamoyladenosine(37)-C(2))-methylthiotransferase MtaB [Clostridia bacterium]|nr:tRNA (N(6)-L-threonylcarbamoyladenosine(37)-C(2))-methylthiotransferase MtaB [Clostridia bacterium]